MLFTFDKLEVENQKLKNMELKEFIKETLSQVINGVKESQEVLKGTGAIIAPKLTKRSADSYELSDYHTASSQVHEIKFSVGLTIENKNGEAGGLTVFTGWINAGGKVNSEVTHQNLTSVDFTIPIVFPSGDDPKVRTAWVAV